MSRPLLPALVLVLSLGAAAFGCQNYSDTLTRAQGHYENARYEAAIANLEDMEGDIGHLSRPERVRYEFIRGMSYFRLQGGSDAITRDHAHHWLVVAWQDAQHTPGALSDEWNSTLVHAIAQLDPNASNMLGTAMPANAGGSGGEGDAGVTPQRGRSGS